MAEAKSIELKEEGNRYFARQEYEKAIELYSKAIECIMAAESGRSTLVALYSNRALAFYRLQKYFHCNADCTAGIEQDPKFAKLYYRRAMCLLPLNCFLSARNDLLTLLDLDPTNEEARKELAQLEKKLNVKSVRIEPVKIDDRFTCKQALKKVAIVNQDENKPEVKKHENVPQPRTNPSLLSAMACPRNYSEFERCWRDPILPNGESKLGFLKTIPADSLNEILSYPLEPDVMLTIIQALSLSPDAQFVYRVLESLTRSSRFPLNLMLFTNSEKQELKQIVDKIQASKEIGEEECARLCKSYNI